MLDEFESIPDGSLPEEPSVTIYTPSEAAEKLGISLWTLAYYRRTGRIQGRDVGNTTLYTEEQIAAANLTKFKSGRPRKRVAEGENGEENPAA